MSHSVAVVSVLQVTMDAGAVGFQLKLVMGGKLQMCCLLWGLAARDGCSWCESGRSCRRLSPRPGG